MNANPTPLSLSQPLALDDARQAAVAIASQRKEARRSYEQALVDAAETKHEFRKALAIAFVSSEGDTAAAREADAKRRAADHEKRRDIAEGMVKVAQERLNEIDGERASFHRLCEWSLRVDPDAREDRSPANPQTVGAAA